MNTNSPFYIYISSTPISGGNGTGDGDSTPSDPSSPQSSKKVSGQFISKYALTRCAESAVHTTIRIWNKVNMTYGYAHGNYIEQEDSQFVASVTGKLLNTAVGIGASLVTGHIVTAGIIAVVSVVNTSIDVGFNVYQNYMETKNSNYSYDQLSKRAGLNSIRSGSRGTED